MTEYTGGVKGVIGNFVRNEICMVRMVRTCSIMLNNEVRDLV